MIEKMLKGDCFESVLEGLSVGEFFFNYAQHNGEKICQIDADLDQSETFSSVRLRSIRLAIQLKKKGLSSEHVVALCSKNSLDNTIPIIAALFLGAKVCCLDPTLSVRQAQHLLSLVSPRLIFVEEDSLPLIEKSLAEENLTSEIIIFGKSSKYLTFSDLVLPSPNEEEFRPSKVDLNDTAVMFFSSGTTGLPKAICHSHSSFLNLTETSARCKWKCDVILHFTTFYWISGMLIFSLNFFTGGTRVFARQMEGESTFKMIEKYKLTALFVAPIYTYKLTSGKNPERYDVSSFRSLLTGGTPLSTEQYKKLELLFPQAVITFGYGMTEIGIISTFHPIRDQNLLKSKIGSCGKVVDNTVLKIVNPDNDKILGPNQKGEIRIKSPSLMKGYYKRDSTDCFDNDGFLKSGDIGYYDEDNCLYVIERMKEMFKYLSWHIVPSSIEAVLLEHPAVKESVVFGLPRGEEGEIPAACVVLKEDCDADEDEIQKFVEERVSDKERLRGGVVFVNNLPKTPSGKLIRNEVRKIAIQSM